MASSLTAHEKKIAQIFSADYAFSIPGYQRPYAWTRDQASELFDDLTGFMRGRAEPVSEMPPYFLGSIVLIKADHAPDADVVDGQQRLTTLTLLLSALRAHLDKENAEPITSLIYQKGAPILGTQDHFRLLPRERDRDFFRDHVQIEGGFERLLAIQAELPDSQHRIRDNGRYFAEQIGALSPHERQKLAQFIVTRCFLVVVSTPDLESAYRIFSVMNSRGLDLSATDILKAEVIGKIPEAGRELYTLKWEDAEEDLGREAFGELFSHLRMIYRKAKPHGTLLKEFQEHVSAVHAPAALIDDLIVPASDIYREIIGASYSSSQYAEQVNRNLKWLNRLEFSDWMPPALRFAIRNRNTPATMRDFFADLERLGYAMMIDRWGVNDRIERFSRLTREIEENADLTAPASALQLTDEEKAAVLETLSGDVYDLLSARARSSLLLRLDDLISGGGAVYDYATVTVEHILPQTPAEGSQWTTWFPDADARKQLVHRLGNLALLTRKKNSAASNYEFDRKKAAYFTNGGVSPFPLTTQVLQHATWSPDIIANRQVGLLATLSQHWRLS